MFSSSNYFCNYLCALAHVFCEENKLVTPSERKSHMQLVTLEYKSHISNVRVQNYMKLATLEHKNHLSTIPAKKSHI